jgi:hypothetical protein
VAAEPARIHCETVPINRWWDKASGEIYWLEITGRPDIGADLKAPQRDDRGQEYWSYSLVTEITPGDIVFHYDRNRHRIVSWSRTVGEAWEEDILWAARGTSARETGNKPYVRPGWKLGLSDHDLVRPPVSLSQMQARRPEILALEADLERTYGGSIYMPLVRYRSTIRAQQGYLTKLPRQLVQWFPPLAQAAQLAVTTTPTPAAPAPMARDHAHKGQVGSTYRPADEVASISGRDPMRVDPAMVERGTQGHARAQNLIAEAVRRSGFDPRSPAPGEPHYDLCWQHGKTIWVIEVKSLTDENEERQLRLGLGQILRYRSMLETTGTTIRGAVMTERKPADPAWHDLFGGLGIVLVWPELIQQAGGLLPAGFQLPAASDSREMLSPGPALDSAVGRSRQST